MSDTQIAAVAELRKALAAMTNRPRTYAIKSHEKGTLQSACECGWRGTELPADHEGSAKASSAETVKHRTDTGHALTGIFVYADTGDQAAFFMVPDNEAAR